MVVFIIGVLVLLADQASKWAAVRFLTYTAADGARYGKTLPLWQDVFHLTYVENRGAAFGILQNQKWFFVLFTLAALTALAVYLVRAPQSKLVLTAAGLAAGGAAGNLIDRVLRGYVVDFFDFRLIHYPVFNIADCGIVIAALLICIYILFFEGRKRHGG